MNTVVEFVKNYFVFLLVLYLFSYLAPQESYRKYFRFFVSALMIAVLMKPVLGIMQKDVRDEAMLQLDSIAEQLEENQYENFTVLKNASETALYGSRGASGVIQVKTKKGTGRGFQISYEGNCGLEAMCKSMEMLNAAEYIAAAQKLGLEYNDKGYNTNFRQRQPQKLLTDQRRL